METVGGEGGGIRSGERGRETGGRAEGGRIGPVARIRCVHHLKFSGFVLAVVATGATG